MIACGAEAYHGANPREAVVIANVGCVHEHVYIEVGVCADCLEGLRTRRLNCSACSNAGCRSCPMLVQVVREPVSA